MNAAKVRLQVCFCCVDVAVSCSNCYVICICDELRVFGWRRDV